MKKITPYILISMSIIPWLSYASPNIQVEDSSLESRFIPSETLLEKPILPKPTVVFTIPNVKQNSLNTLKVDDENFSIEELQVELLKGMSDIFRGRAYVGYIPNDMTRVNQDKTVGYEDRIVPIQDIGLLSDEEYEGMLNTLINDVLLSSEKRDGTIFPSKHRTLFNALNLIRGEPTTTLLVTDPPPRDSFRELHRVIGKRYETSMRYRCQQNHIIKLDPVISGKHFVGNSREQYFYAVNPYDYDFLKKSIDEAPFGVFSPAKSRDGSYTYVDSHDLGSDIGLTDVHVTYINPTNTLGRLIGTTDLRSGAVCSDDMIEPHSCKRMKVNGQWRAKVTDDAGKDWLDDQDMYKNGRPGRISIHTIYPSYKYSLSWDWEKFVEQNDPNGDRYDPNKPAYWTASIDTIGSSTGGSLYSPSVATGIIVWAGHNITDGITGGSGGNTGLTNDFYRVNHYFNIDYKEDDNIFSQARNILRINSVLVSNTLALNDKKISTLPPKMTNNEFLAFEKEMEGIVNYYNFDFNKLPIDLDKVGAIHYDTAHNYINGEGQLRATIAIDVPKKVYDYASKKFIYKPDVRTVPLWNSNRTIKRNQGNYVTFNPYNKKPIELTTTNIKSLANDTKFDTQHEKWLRYDSTPLENARNKLRDRFKPLGSFPNSDIKMVLSDALYINTALALYEESTFNQYLRHKATHFSNLIVLGDDTGLIRFINATRGLKGTKKPGEQYASYFPFFLHERIEDITSLKSDRTILMDGKINVYDGIVSKSSGEYLTTSGLSGMGGGGKAIMGYQLYGVPKAQLNDIAISGDLTIKPLFEIVNEGSNKTPGFENLGYTYSGFQFFNRRIANSKAQVVGVFGNGYGSTSNVSSLYLIDAYTGDLVKEIILSNDGGGASTPTIIVENDGTRIQKLNRVYVGDYSGELYKLTFDQDLNVTEKITLFSAPKTNTGQSSISVQPLVVQDKNKNYWIYFGTGLKASKLDQGANSLVTHNLFAIKDHEKNSTLYREDLAENRLSYQDMSGTPDLMRDDGSYTLNITPSEKTTSQIENGWYIPLDLEKYGDKVLGERLIVNPQYDNNRDIVYFNTWGLYDLADLTVIEGFTKDPCLPLVFFGKNLSLDPTKGILKTYGDNDGAISHVGNTGGNYTGDSLTSGASDELSNNQSILNEDISKELIDITGSADSSLSYDDGEDGTAVRCQTMSNGEVICVSENKPFNKRLFSQKGRVYLKHI